MIENKIEEILLYFKNKIFNGEFVVIEYGTDDIQIKIDDKYNFDFCSYVNSVGEIRFFQIIEVWENNFINLQLTTEENNLIYKLFNEKGIFENLEKTRAIKEIKEKAKKYNLNLNNL